MPAGSSHAVVAMASARSSAQDGDGPGLEQPVGDIDTPGASGIMAAMYNPVAMWCHVVAVTVASEMT